ncbi:MAG: hypothetical protein FJ098_04930, partial [Deltaproteobacteria bacterium]|nr:hypothetical protein [Deltaproteobacteria bacterium]
MGTRSVAVALWLALWACGAGPEVDPGQDTVDSGGPGDSTVELAWDATDGGGELPPPDAAPDGARDGAIESLDQEAADPCAADNGGCGDPDRVECLAVPGLGVQCLDRCDTDYPVLVAGVHSIDQGGAAPSLLVVHGPRACPLVADEAGRVLVAYTRAGSGRVVHAGHEALIVSPSGDAETLVLNLVRWLGGAPSPVVGIEAGTEGPQALLGAAGLSVIPGVGVGDLAAIDVLVTNSYVERSDEDLQALVGWVEGGGGLLQGGHAWWWSYSHDDVFGQYPGNRILNALGITVTASTDVSAGVEVLPAEGLPPLLHARRALHAVALHVAGEAPLPHEEQILAAATLVTAVSQLPLAFEAFFGPLRDVLAGIPAVCPTREEPVVPAEAPLDALVVSLLTKLALELPAGEVEPLPCDFPGPVPPDAEEVTRTLVLDASYPGLDPDYSFADAGDPLWLGTGLYAAPGRPVEVTASASWAGQGLSIRVSPFTDTLWGASSWTRFPEVSRSWPLEGVELTVASAFGGPIYLEVPGGVALGPGQVTFQGAVPMARYVHGETADFQEQLAAAPAPVVELEGDGLVLTVLREELSPAVEPEALMGFWGEVLAADAVLAALDGPRPRPERIAVDRQISAGWMHSGYPVM